MATGVGASGPKLSGMKYLVESIVHADATGTVMLIGDQGDLGRRYVLKVIKREGPESDAWIEQARVAFEGSAKLGHPVPLKYHDFRLRRKWFRVERAELLMEHVKGKSLDQLGELTLDQLILIYRELAAALMHMHRRGVCHGDLRPEHVLVSRDGEVRLMGYGWSLRSLAFKDVMPGSKRYMAPEQIKGKVLDEKSDVYALGAMMYHLMTGQPANVGGRAQGDAEKITIPARLNPAISAPLNNLLVSCLQGHPPKRPEGMYEVQQRLDAIIAERGLDASTLKDASAPAAE